MKSGKNYECAYLGCGVTYASKTRGTLLEMHKYALHSESGKHCIK